MQDSDMAHEGPLAKDAQRKKFLSWDVIMVEAGATVW